LVSFVFAVGLASSAYAGISLNDLPYIQGTPIADASWEIQDYSQNGNGIHWVWLRQGSDTAYLVYPSEEATQLPDNSVVAPSDDQMTLRFIGGPEQELLFTRFGSALFTLIGADIEVHYTAAAANTTAGAYPGDLSVSASEIHMEGELTLDGGMVLNAQETLGLYGNMEIQDDLSVEASTGVVMGTVKNNSIVLDACGVHDAGVSTNIHIETSLSTKGCVGDVILDPEIEVRYESSEAATLQTSSQASSGSKGGSADWWLIAVLAALPFARKRQLTKNN